MRGVPVFFVFFGNAAIGTPGGSEFGSYLHSLEMELTGTFLTSSKKRPGLKEGASWGSF